MSERTVVNQADQNQRLVPTGEEFMYRVAELAWLEGLAPNSIARRLGDPGLIMAVKRALERAVREQVLILRPPVVADLERQLLHQKIWKARSYTVVKNELFHEVDAVYLAAAEQMKEIILTLLKTRPSSEEVIVANAGGRAVSESVKLLHRIAPSLDHQDRGRLIFLSLNSAGRRRSFDQSSNFLAVRLAEVFGGRHIAILDHTDPMVEEEYRKNVRCIDVLLCGAGGLDSLLSEHAREQNVSLPEGMVGDFAFIPLDREGRPIENERLKTVLCTLSPHPEYSEVLRIARDRTKVVMVVLTGFESKLPAAHAILTSGLATHCVLGAPFAKRLIERYGPPLAGR